MSLLGILQHSLGVDQYGQGEVYRNHFVAGEGSDDHPICMEAVERGLMSRRAGNALTGDMDLFLVTETGKQFVRDDSPKPPKTTRAQRRYKAFLRHDSSLRFIEWLQSYGKEVA